jgi:NAD(P)-dependent dehydrogenase (short-subunit alcohol dehydrogenase family)
MMTEAPSVKRTALVTGANRGIGFEVCRQLAAKGLRVILTARDASAGEKAARELARSGGDITFQTLDVSSESSVAAAAKKLTRAEITVDVLINNAGVYPPGGLLNGPTQVIKDVMAVNFFGPLWTCRTFLPGMMERGYGRVVNVSSGAGSFAGGLQGPGAYCVSKAALNALTAKLAREVRGDVKINAVCPGWVRTRMGGPGASRSVERGAETIVWLALLGANGPTGGYFRDRRPISW